MMIEQLAAQSFAAARRGDGDREDFRLARDEAGENERDDAVRDSGAMGLMLAVHLGVVMALFATLPYGKFAHGIFRSAALLKAAIEKRQASKLQLGSD